MAPIAKDVENPAVTTAPAAPANKPPQDAAAARPQPVALEVPVTVNGARTVDGSDKREPFSESTKTVLVFGHGAVIRLASQVAPGQLLFVTNEKTKKEVVCQVVKSKNYRTVTGYVELEFTEPAAGFWGMRFPAEKTATAPAPTSVAPVAPAAVQRPAAPVSPSSPTSPKVVAPLPAPVAVKPPAPAPVPAKPIAVAPPAVSPAAAKPEPPKTAVPTEIHAASEIAPRSTPLAPAAPVLPVQAGAPPSPEVAKTVLSTPAVDPTTEALKQQAARLQEQLGSLLFTETPAAKQPPQEPAVTPKPDMIPTETVQKILQIVQVDAKPAVLPAKPLPESKPAPITPKSSPVSMAVEEVKIPAWLAPLARETESGASQGTAETETSTDSEATATANPNLDSLFSDGEVDSTTVQPTMFGGQLLVSSSAGDEVSSSGGSKKGLFIGIAAAVILLVGGGAWYANQPGNALSGLLAAKPAVTQTVQTAQNTPAPASQPAFRPETATPTSSATNPVSQPAPAKSVTPIPAASSAVNSTPVPAVVKETTSAPRNAPPVEQPKKPVLGDVRLATPNVNRSAGSEEGNVSAPSIDAGQAATAEPLVSLAGSSAKEPEAPRPIGGDVQPAKLIKAVPPIYPPAARTQRVGGDVKIDALIDASGNVASMKVLSGPTLLHQAAMTALKQWKYEPAKLDGNPTTMHLTVTVQFRLQ